MQIAMHGYNESVPRWLKKISWNTGAFYFRNFFTHVSEFLGYDNKTQNENRSKEKSMK